MGIGRLGTRGAFSGVAISFRLDAQRICNLLGGTGPVEGLFRHVVQENDGAPRGHDQSLLLTVASRKVGFHRYRVGFGLLAEGRDGGGVGKVVKVESLYGVGHRKKEGLLRRKRDASAL